MNAIGLKAGLLAQHVSSNYIPLIQSFAAGVSLIATEFLRTSSGSLGAASGTTNVQGETQTTLDARSDELLIGELFKERSVLAVISEEQERPVLAPDFAQRVTEPHPQFFVVACDPLDGSSNIPFNIPVGSIFAAFSITPTEANRTDISPEALITALMLSNPLRSRIAASGYAVYGARIQLICSAGKGVLDTEWSQNSQDFLVANTKLTTPSTGAIYSVNEGASASWSAIAEAAPVARFIQGLKARGGFSGRYVGSLVSDFDRNLRKGGVYLYPPDKKNNRGKLRALYEGVPLAFICEQAGGKAFNGAGAVLDGTVLAVHERTPLYIGSSELVTELEQQFKAT